MSKILEAAELAFALERGFINLAEVTAWADEIIGNADVSNADIVSIALSKSKSEAITNLKTFSGDVDIFRIIRKFSTRFLDIEDMTIQQAKRLSDFFYKLIAYNECVPDELSNLGRFASDFDGALEGWGRSQPNEVVTLFMDEMRRIARNSTNSLP